MAGERQETWIARQTGARHPAVGWVGTVAALVVVVVLAEIALRSSSIPSYILPFPSDVARLLIKKSASYLDHTMVTGAEALSGFLIGNVVAYLFAILLTHLPRLRQSGMVLAITIKVVPVLALGPLFVIWFGNGIVGKCLLSALVTFFPMLINGLTGLSSVDDDVLAYYRSLGARGHIVLWHVRMPASLPYVMAAAKMSATICVVGAIVAELSGSDRGLGFILLTSVYQVETTAMFAAVVCSAVLGLALYGAIAALDAFLGQRRLT